MPPSVGQHAVTRRTDSPSPAPRHPRPPRDHEPGFMIATRSGACAHDHKPRGAAARPRAWQGGLMDYTNLGRTGLAVSRLCLGTMNFGPQTSEPDSFA